MITWTKTVFQQPPQDQEILVWDGALIVLGEISSQFSVFVCSTPGVYIKPHQISHWSIANLPEAIA